MHTFDWIGIRRDEPELVRDDVHRFFVSPGVSVDPEMLAADRKILAETSVVAQGGWCSIHPPQPLQFARELAARLSRNINAPALLMRVPRDYWEYRLYIGGCEVDRFSQVPELSEPYATDLSGWKGQPVVLASAFGVPESTLSKYLVQWPKDAWQRPADYAADTKRFSWGRKALDDDEFPVSDYWVLCDFARRIGLAYDMPETHGVAIDG